ncbi:uncharacterized protein LOC116344877 isoform X1 [Contarinia nasturtii]|uniref:uncharacterized protein LOC116344877 isoform X1 n=1 Tax=Contarinia nasturtii TaxID=265458 RepID=UPI0012D47818|nr:uncharacterized protein LOC116344877 isoform X1 [Contarinia nasturtii]XP_031629574.1 uncharacterized protein LOC116344877 isoform X1 [Contarinia nasturtii]
MNASSMHISIDSIKSKLSNVFNGVNSLGTNITYQLSDLLKGEENIQSLMSNRFHEALLELNTSIELRETFEEMINEMTFRLHKNLKLNELITLVDDMDKQVEQLTLDKLPKDAFVQRAVNSSSDGGTIVAMLNRIRAIATNNIFSDDADTSLNQYLKVV